MILVTGCRTDPPAAAVLDACERSGGEVVFVDYDDADQIRASGAGDTAQLKIGNRDFGWSELTGVYLRSPERLADPRRQHHAHTLAAWIDRQAELADPKVTVLNRPAAAATNGSKPNQARAVARAGFAIPQGLLTTDPQAAQQFVASHGLVIVKSISGVRSIVRLVNPEEDFAAVQWCPTQFQRYVPGDEFRVHVVGQTVIAHGIESTDVDYRYGYACAVPAELPGDVSQRCVELARQLGLELAGIDLRLSPTGEWFCFEANTSPAFTSFDHDGRIADAIAIHLTRSYQPTP